MNMIFAHYTFISFALLLPFFQTHDDISRLKDCAAVTTQSTAFSSDLSRGLENVAIRFGIVQDHARVPKR
jgi:hypothetical protein